MMLKSAIENRMISLDLPCCKLGPILEDKQWRFYDDDIE